MDKVRHYISDVLEELCTRVFADVCRVQRDGSGNVIQSVFAGHRPSAIKRLTEFLVVLTSPSIGEHNV